MRNYKHPLILLLLFTLFSIFCDETTDSFQGDEVTLEETLLYGIESEIQNFIKAFQQPLSDQYMRLLFSRYQTAALEETKKSIIQYFQRCESIPEYILKQTLEDASSDFTPKTLRRNAFSVLSKHGKEKEHRFLIEKLDDSDRVIQTGAASALSKVTDIAIAPLLLERLEKAEESNDPSFESADSEIQEDFYLPTEIKNNLILSLGEMKYQPAVPYLKKILETEENDPFSQMYAMYSLAKIGDLSSITEIQKKLSSNDARIREYAASSLSSYRDSSVIPICAEMLKHNDTKVRLYGCRGLVNNNDTSQLNLLLYKFRKDPEGTVRNEALRSLLSLGAPGVAAVKKEMEKKKLYPALLATVSEGVAASPNSENVAYLLELYQKTDKKGKEAIAKNIVKSTSHLVDPLLAELLQSDDYLLRMGATNALLNIKETSLHPKVKELSEKDSVPTVRRNAQRVLNILENVSPPGNKK